MKNAIAAAALVLASTPFVAPDAHAFCGFYVAKADTKLFNKASQVVLVRTDDKTVLTMANDFKGDPREFAIVIPVPTFLEREQINVGDRKVIDHLDAYTSPRLVEYFDPDPCNVPMPAPMAIGSMRGAPAKSESARPSDRAKSLGVTIEATYTVGEYDILILSAKESDGLETWLKENGYKIPAGASEILGTYIKQKMRFFVAKVNLKEKSKLGFANLRPLQVAYESPKFMLPIRLGTVNADGPQELFVYALTKKGRVETTNYRTVKLPSDLNVPTYVKAEFGPFYKAMFAEQVKKQEMKAVFLEYAWNMNWCDPCAAEPLTPEELRKLGVFWVAKAGAKPTRPGAPQFIGGAAQEVYVSRLHVRYDAQSFPEDLVFQETADASNFQGRYIMQHAFKGDLACDAADGYYQGVRAREEQEAKNLADLTGWQVADIRTKMKLDEPVKKKAADKNWYKDIWK